VGAWLVSLPAPPRDRKGERSWPSRAPRRASRAPTRGRDRERAELGRLGLEVDQTIEELRDLAQGAYPQVLARPGSPEPSGPSPAARRWR